MKLNRKATTERRVVEILVDQLKADWIRGFIWTELRWGMRDPQRDGARYGSQTEMGKVAPERGGYYTSFL